MFIVTITDREGMTYTAAFREAKDARRFIPPARARLKTPTRRTAVLWKGEECIGEFNV